MPRWGESEHLEKPLAGLPADHTKESNHVAKIIVSYDGTANEEDAIALGRLLGRAGAEVSLAYVRHNPETDSVREEIAQAEAQSVLDQGVELLGDRRTPSATSSPTARRRRASRRSPSVTAPT